MSAIAKKFMPDVYDDKNEDNKSKVMNEDKWIKPKNCMPINYFYKTCENKSEWEKKNNKHIALVDNDEIKEEEEDKIKVNNNTSKIMKAKVVKNNVKQVKTSNKQKHKSKSNERLENDGDDYEE